MTSNPDFQDFTLQSSRMMASAAESPIVFSTAGWQTVTVTVPLWARSLNLMVNPVQNVISLMVEGQPSGFVYLNSVPSFDGGMYYIPMMPVVDSGLSIRFYQVAAVATTIYAVFSDEPIAIANFNPITPTSAITEHMVNGSPFTINANIQTTETITLDVTTQAIRCGVDNLNNIVWGKVIGVQSLEVYYDGSGTSSSFPTTPIPINRELDSTLHVIVKSSPTAAIKLYVIAVNVPDQAGDMPSSAAMAANELAPSIHQITTPNKAPVIFDGTIAGGATQALLVAAAGVQLRLHAVNIMQYTAVESNIWLQDSNGVVYLMYHYGAAENVVYAPLFGQIVTIGAGMQLRNQGGVVSGALAVTLWYSVL